jgi:hypothetical protein
LRIARSGIHATNPTSDIVIRGLLLTVRMHFQPCRTVGEATRYQLSESVAALVGSDSGEGSRCTCARSLRHNRYEIPPIT